MNNLNHYWPLGLSFILLIAVLVPDRASGLQDRESSVDKPSEQKVEAAEQAADKPLTDQKFTSDYDPRSDEGILHDIAEPLSKILKFERTGEKLRWDVPTSYSDADAAFREIRSKGRGGGGGHGSGDFWTQYVSSQFFGGRIQRSEQNFGGDQQRRPEALSAEFIESANHSGSFEVQADDNENFVIRINGGLVPYYLQVVQTSTGFSVQEVNGGYAFAASGNSFEDFCRRNPDYVQQRLLSILKHYGVASPITRFNQVTRDHVIALLSPADDAALNEFRDQFQDLESTDYEKREAATQKLTKEFDQWKTILRYAAGSDRFSLEVRSRLQKLIKDKSSEEDRQLIALVAASDLTQDPEYLVWLLGQFSEEATRSYVAAQLKKITGEDLGTDEQAWIRHLSAKPDGQPGSAQPNGSVAETDEALPQLVEAVGYLPRMAVPTANLLQLKSEEGRLKLNRESWSAQFNGESIETLYNKLAAQLEKSNLPKSWLQSGGHSLQFVSHEHVLFEHIQAAIPPQSRRNSYSYGNISGYRSSQINRQVEQPHLLLQLDREQLKTDDKRNRIMPTKNEPNVFHFSARERDDSCLDLSLVELQDNSLHLTIASRNAQSVFHLAQQADGQIACHLLSGGSQRSISGKNFQELYTNHRGFVDEIIYPLFVRFGIQVAPEIGGPLKIQNAEAPLKNESKG